VSAQAVPFREAPAGSKSDRPPQAFQVLAWCVTCGAITCVAFGLMRNPQEIQENAGIALIWILIAAGVGLVPVKSGYGLAFSIDIPLLLASAFVFSPFTAGAIALAGACDVREIRRTTSLTSAAFNRAQIALCVMTASAVFHGINGPGGSRSTEILAAVLALAVDVALNYVLVVASYVLRQPTSLTDVLRQMKLGSTPGFVISYLCLGVMSVLFAESYLHLGVWGLAYCTVPMVLVWRAFSAISHLEVADKRVASGRRALHELTVNIVEERRDERAKIAASLHDDVLQSLYNVKIHTHVIREDLRHGRLLELDDDLPALLAAAESASDGLRGVIRDIRQSSLGREGLPDTLRLLIREAQESEPARIRSTISSIDASAEVQLLLYQIAKEALFNACKHSHASVISVELYQEGDTVCLVVEDDGIGFDPLSVDAREHFGIQLMEERAAGVNAELRVDSKPSQGTRLTASMPAHPG
jgi:signal transduction histidine kinase